MCAQNSCGLEKGTRVVVHGRNPWFQRNQRQHIFDVELFSSQRTSPWQAIVVLRQVRVDGMAGSNIEVTTSFQVMFSDTEDLWFAGTSPSTQGVAAIETLTTLNVRGKHAQQGRTMSMKSPKCSE